VPKQRLELVEAGAVRQIPYSRQAAHRAAAEPTGHGSRYQRVRRSAHEHCHERRRQHARPDDRLHRARLLVTRLWYIREVDPYQKIMTGMTRDGTFLIEDGQIAGGVRNFRFTRAWSSC